MTPEGNVGRITNETTLSGDVSRGPTPINGLEIPPAPVVIELEGEPLRSTGDDLIWQWFGYGPDDSDRLERIVKELAKKTGHSVATCRCALAAITWKPAADALHKEGTTLAKAMADLEDGPKDYDEHKTRIATETRTGRFLFGWLYRRLDPPDVGNSFFGIPVETDETMALDAIALKHGQAIDDVALTTGGRVSSPRPALYTRAVGRRTITRNSRRFVRPAGKPQIGDAQELAFETERDLVTGLGATLTGAATFAAGAPWWLAILAGLVVGIGVVGGYEIARRRER